MATTFNCPACRRLIAAEVDPGTHVQCPLCRQIVTVPGPTGAPPTTDWNAAAPGPGLRPTGGLPPLPGQVGAGVTPGLRPLDYPQYPFGQQLSESMAIGALVCGILGLVACPVLCSLVGVILGIVALVQANREPQRYGGRGKAIAGIATGATGVVIWPLLVVAFVPLIKQGVQVAMREQCTTNLMMVGQAMKLYGQMNNGALPDATADWRACLTNTGIIGPMQLSCPSDSAPLGSDLHYVPGFTTKASPRTIVLYEDPANHFGQGGAVVYSDGTSTWLPAGQFEKAIAAIKLPDGTAYDPNKAGPGAHDEEEDENE